MNWLDDLTTRYSRSLAHRTSRRSLLTRLGTLAVGAASIPLLPIARAADGYPGVASQSTGNPGGSRQPGRL